MVITEKDKRKSENLKLSIGGNSRSSPRNSQSSSPATPNSPLTQKFPEISSQGSSPTLSDISLTDSNKTRTNKKSQCPCGKSSGGQSWNIPCLTCKQVWHNSCAGLKAEFTRPVLDSLTKSWQCPWCYCCPFQRPQNHISVKNARELGDRVLTADFIQQITDSVADVMSKQFIAPPTTDISGIQSQLDTLTLSIQELRENRAQPHKPDCPPIDLISTDPFSFNLDCNEKPLSDSKTDYLSVNQEGEVLQLLKHLKENKLFKNKNGRSTISYGEHYAYSGSTDKPAAKEIPPKIKEIISKITEDYNLNESQVPNSVLINYFPQKVADARNAKSSLPKHSDDEIEITPESSIFTYSVGGPRNVVFSANFTDETDVYEAKPNSLYVMSRKSQSWYKHEILDAEACEERFSVTMRHVSKSNQRSMLIIGDSNTKEIKFGSGTGTVGEKYPGKRIKAAKIHQIDPRDCVGYSNIIISCGTNDLRPAEIKGQLNNYIHNLVQTLKSKIEEINSLTQTKIFVMPVPPSRDQSMNKNILAFNNLLFQSEFIARFNIWMPGLYSFLDRSGMLNSNLTRGGDPIHFGEKGICMYVRIIKDAVYQRERVESRGPWTNDTRNPTSGSRKPP